MVASILTGLAIILIIIGGIAYINDMVEFHAKVSNGTPASVNTWPKVLFLIIGILFLTFL